MTACKTSTPGASMAPVSFICITSEHSGMYSNNRFSLHASVHVAGRRHDDFMTWRASWFQHVGFSESGPPPLSSHTLEIGDRGDCPCRSPPTSLPWRDRHFFIRPIRDLNWHFDRVFLAEYLSSLSGWTHLFAVCWFIYNTWLLGKHLIFLIAAPFCCISMEESIYCRIESIVQSFAF